MLTGFTKRYVTGSCGVCTHDADTKVTGGKTEPKLHTRSHKENKVSLYLLQIWKAIRKES
jgi:hypothetical protein